MVKVNEYVEMLKKEVTAQLRQQIKNDQAAYKTLIKDLLIQVSKSYSNSFIFKYFAIIGLD